jgi:hypothetical protein
MGIGIYRGLFPFSNWFTFVDSISHEEHLNAQAPTRQFAQTQTHSSRYRETVELGLVEPFRMSTHRALETVGFDQYFLPPSHGHHRQVLPR